MKRLIPLFCLVSLLTGCGPVAEPAKETAKADAKPGKAYQRGVFIVEEAEQQKANIVTEVVRPTDVFESVAAQGQLALNEDRVWRVGAVAGGRVEALPVKLGEMVRRDQVIGRIHSHDEHEARAAYEQAITELDRAKKAQTYALQRRDRARRLLEVRAGSKQDLESAEAELTNSVAGIEKAESQLRMEKTHLTDILRVPLKEDGTATKMTEGIPIYAPATGVVWERKATEGSVVNTGDEVLSLADLSSLWMIAAVNESELSKLRVGQTVRVHVRAYPERGFSGSILKLGEKLDAETRTLQVRVAIPNPQGLLKPEMYATADFRQGEKHSAVFVPESAVQDINGVPAVFVRRSANEFESRAVRTGKRSEGQVEILEGLQGGDAIAVRGAFQLKSELLKSSIQE